MVQVYHLKHGDRLTVFNHMAFKKFTSDVKKQKIQAWKKIWNIKQQQQQQHKWLH